MPRADISPEVQIQLLRPGQLEARANACPVVYVPLGPIEWHGRHLPLGCDALKAHGVVCQAAEKHGGVVYPPTYLHDGWDLHIVTPLLTDLFGRLKMTGFRVIVGVSGHNVPGMIDMINAALVPVVEDGTVRGLGIWEISLSESAECGSDHAAKWETSDMLYLYPDRTDLAELGSGPIELDMSPPSGIGGEDPREHASASVGRRCVELAADAIGKKAGELLASLPAEYRTFGQSAITPETWWMI